MNIKHIIDIVNINDKNNLVIHTKKILCLLASVLSFLSIKTIVRIVVSNIPINIPTEHPNNIDPYMYLLETKAKINKKKDIIILILKKVSIANIYMLLNLY